MQDYKKKYLKYKKKYFNLKNIEQKGGCFYINESTPIVNVDSIFISKPDSCTKYRFSNIDALYEALNEFIYNYNIYIYFNLDKSSKYYTLLEPPTSKKNNKNRISILSALPSLYKIKNNGNYNYIKIFIKL